VTLPNFGDEKGVAEALRTSELNVPVLVHAFSDDVSKMTIKHRRDSFCGKMSVCNNLRQYGMPFTLTSLHTEDPNSDVFAADIDDFGVTCRVIRSLKGLRIGAIGARPAAFNTCRYSEKLLQDSGISVETLDLSEILGRAERLKSSDAKLKAKLKAVTGYVPCKGINKPALEKMARLAVVLEEYVKANDLGAVAMQCWTAIEEFYGVVPCAVMSMMSNALLPAACEVDVCGALSMYILQAASNTPSALLDWNNNYGEDPDRCVMFHCSNLPKCFFKSAEMAVQDIIAGSVGKNNACGTVVGQIAPNPATLLRLSTDEFSGGIKGYIAEGEFTDDELKTFGGAGVLRINDLQTLLAHICDAGFEHHTAANLAHVGNGVVEALTTYMGWDVHYHL